MALGSRGGQGSSGLHRGWTERVRSLQGKPLDAAEAWAGAGWEGRALLHPLGPSSGPGMCSPFAAQQQKASFFLFISHVGIERSRFSCQRFVFPPVSLHPHPSPFRNPITQVSFVPVRWHLVASRRIIPGAAGLRQAASPSLPPSVPPGGVSVGEPPQSHPEQDGPMGCQESSCAAPTLLFAPCLSFPAGKQGISPPPTPQGRAGFGTIANLPVIILGAESSITQSRAC